jgi:hypothetical protein
VISGGRVLPAETLTPEELAAGATKYAHTKNAGILIAEIPALKGASYRLEQRLGDAQLLGAFATPTLTLRARSRVDANRNLLVTELSCDGEPAEIILRQERSLAPALRISDGLLSGYRDGDGLPGARRVAWATRVLGATTEPETSGGLRLKILPGITVTLVTALVSDSESGNPLGQAEKDAAGVPQKELGALRAQHEDWWRDF